MVTVLDVPTDALLNAVKEDFKTREKLKQPEWALFVKTGQQKERAPMQEDWWYVRGASILRKFALDSSVLGVNKLRSAYGGRKTRGVKPHRFRKGSGKIIRVWLQALDKEGFLKKLKVGRVLSPKGQQYLNQKAAEVLEKTKAETKEIKADVL